MFSVKLLTIIIIVVFTFGCSLANGLVSIKRESEEIKIEEPKNQENIEKSIEEIPKDFLVTLDKPLCQGFEICQIYKIAVKADGTVLFEGIQNTKYKGKTKGKISREKVKELIKEFEKANYFNLNDKYNFETCPNSFTDHHDVNTSIQLNGKKKSISHYLGCIAFNTEFEKPLADLTLLGDKIGELSGAKRWIGEIK